MTRDEARNYLTYDELEALDALTHPAAIAAGWAFALRLAKLRASLMGPNDERLPPLAIACPNAGGPPAGQKSRQDAL